MKQRSVDVRALAEENDAASRPLDEFPLTAPWKDDKGDHAAHDVQDPTVPGSVSVVETPKVTEDANVTASVVPERVQLLQEAAVLITGDRDQSYGHPSQNFKNIAEQWNIQFGHMLKPGQKFTGPLVAQAMILVKTSRMIAQPKRDSYLDIAGYAACGWECEVNL